MYFILSLHLSQIFRRFASPALQSPKGSRLGPSRGLQRLRLWRADMAWPAGRHGYSAGCNWCYHMASLTWESIFLNAMKDGRRWLIKTYIYIYILYIYIYILYIYIYNISVRERDRERLRIHIDLHVQTTLCDAGLVCTTDEVRPD